MRVLVVKLMLIYSLLTAVFVFCYSMGLGGNNETDRLALLAIKAQIQQDPHQVTTSWNESIHFCMWHGVACGPRHHQRVIVLDLQSQSLVGSISPHIGNLSFLEELRLQNNSFSHEIPPEIKHLRRLQVLRLENNCFTGLIPHNISNCSNLTLLSLGYNKLVGTIPSEIGSLSKLQKIVLQNNTFTGEIPPSLGNLSSLEVLAFMSNQFSGSIPSSLGHLKKLTYFSLISNNLSGTIPPSICNLSALVYFYASENQIQGSIPSYFGKTLPNLKHFLINVNQFTGPIPPSISNATNLVEFEVAKNKLTGEVPNLQKLHNLQKFNIEVNHLGSGKDGDLSFFSDLSNATKLQWLLLNRNNFGGLLPSSISNLSTKLEMLCIQGNQVHGSIPSGIGNLVSLEYLGMGGNRLRGNIPTEIGKLSRLGRLTLFDNKLSGSLPSSLGNLTILTILQLGNNNLEGDIPPGLGECHSLLEFDLSQNNLSGSIPQQLLNGLPSLSISFDLSRNHFTGSLPMEVGKLRNLRAFDVSDNMLSGELPNTLGSCVHMEVLHLQGNFFNGPLPSSMMSLRGLYDLDLSRNKFSGEIPKFLESFVLLNLNLSFNDFWGTVPIEGVFKNASATSIVGNTRLCSSIPNLHLPKCKTKESKGGRLSHSLKFVCYIVPGCAFLGITKVLFLYFSRKKSTKATTSIKLQSSFWQVSYATLLKATDGFSSANSIGMGSFGSVYRGVLDDVGASIIAVKVFNLLRQGASKSFIAECEALKNIRHRNLVKIITACSSVDFHGNDFKALVYEYMENGSLEEWLHPTARALEVKGASKNLTFLQRLDIAYDVACALDYLHNHCETPIVHCDLKPSNVLLNNELTGHVSDFGLARILTPLPNNVSTNQTSSIGIRGSIGYAAPEYGIGSEVSTYGDVYSYGILLLEMFTGKRPTDYMFNEDLNLHNYVKMTIPERVTEIADSLLLQGGKMDAPKRQSVGAHKMKECLSFIFGIGIACSVESPRDRMHIRDVVSELHFIRYIILG